MLWQWLASWSGSLTSTHHTVPRTTRVFILIHAGITHDLYLVQLRKIGDVLAVNKNWNLLHLRPWLKSNTLYNSQSKTGENYAEFCSIIQSQHIGELLTVNFHPQKVTCKNIKFMEYVVNFFSQQTSELRQ